MSPEGAGEVVVVGAGLAGLGCALHLIHAGVPVRVLERADRPGGQLRTDVVDGFRIDRGFQVHNTAYPEPARLLDSPALRFGRFVRGASLVTDRGTRTFADPRHLPSATTGLLTAPLGSARDRLALARLAAKVALTPARRLRHEPETTTQAYLRGFGFSARAIDTFFRPFLTGVFLEPELATSSRFFLLSFRCFVRGDSVLPADGIEAIPAQLAARLPAGALRLGEPADSLPAARAVVVATDTDTAYRLLPELGTPPALTAVTTYYHRTREDLGGHALLRLDAGARTAVANTTVLTAAVPSYAPAGDHLVSSSVVGAELPEPAVREQLRRFYGPVAGTFEPVTVVRVARATPVQPPPLGTLRRPVRVRPGVYVAGAHRDTASTQGALVSGRRAATAVLADLVVRKGTS